MPDGFSVVVVLQAYVAGAGAGLRIGPRHNYFAIHSNGVILVDASNLVFVLLADGFGVGLVRGLERVDRTGAPGGVFWVGIADFHFMSLVNCVPRVIPGIGKTKENAGVRDFLFLHKFAAENEIGKLPA